jgi:predicted RNA-binding Zn-ribbon protein involved in translation (DUF1610 family)
MEIKSVQKLVHHTVCPECGANTILSGSLYRCRRKACRKAFSLYRGTIFAKSNLPCNKILRMAYLWLAECSHKTIVRITGTSKQAVTNFVGYFRDLVACALDEDDTTIGGQGIVVEIDESKFGKRKCGVYERNHRTSKTFNYGDEKE